MILDDTWEYFDSITSIAKLLLSQNCLDNDAMLVDNNFILMKLISENKNLIEQDLKNLF